MNLLLYYEYAWIGFLVASKWPTPNRSRIVGWKLAFPCWPSCWFDRSFWRCALSRVRFPDIGFYRKMLTDKLREKYHLVSPQLDGILTDIFSFQGFINVFISVYAAWLLPPFLNKCYFIVCMYGWTFIIEGTFVLGAISSWVIELTHVSALQ